MTNNTMLALLAQGYVFSYMAITDFVSGNLWKIWERPSSPLKSKYPKANDFTHLLKRELRETKDCITELCIQLKIKPLHEANPKLWTDLIQTLKETRDFLTHPRPDAVEFDTIVGDAVEKHAWAVPAHIAEQVIRYFHVAQKRRPPGWLSANKEFRIEAIRALSVQACAEV